jgi:hypothetical protein
MPGPSRAFLFEQLAAAVTDCESGRDEPFEVAVLAGLLSRHLASGEPASPAEGAVLAAAERLRRSGVLDAALPNVMTAEDALAELEALCEDDSEEERCEPLFDLDELCAGACFVEKADHYAAVIAAAAAVIRRQAGLWQATAAWVPQLLATAPPLPGDPALLLWRELLLPRSEDERLRKPQEEKTTRSR